MWFNSIDFLIFFVVVFALYQVLPDTWRKVLLLSGSYYFYGCWDYRFLSLLAISTIVDFYCAQAIHRSEDEKKRWRLLLLSLSMNLGFLLVFKYLNFFVDSAVDGLQSIGVEANVSLMKIVLPVGISFYTFQTLSYTFDVYRRQLTPTKSILNFATFVAFFPQLVAGPIERASRFLPQFDSKRSVSENDLLTGIWLTCLGFFKKLVIADRSAMVVGAGFEGSGLPYDGMGDWIFLYAFAFLIYGDFSGYTDIARGIAKLLGYDLMLNFRKPYLVTNASEFWRHWHISLSSWLRDYLYISLGGNRFGALMTYRNLMLTMVLGGLWHGAGWAFFLWGVYQGVLLMGHRMLTPFFDALNAIASKNKLTRHAWHFVTWFAFFHLVCFGWLLFRVGTLPENVNQIAFLSESLQGLFSWSTLDFDWAVVRVVAFVGLITFLLQATYEKLEQFAEWNWMPQVTCLVLLIVGITTLGVFDGAEFIYFQF